MDRAVVDCTTGTTEVRPFTAAEETQRNAEAAAYVPIVAALEAAEVTRSTIVSQATVALTTNRTYLALASPTNAQNAAQVRALTQQNVKIIRLVLGLLDGTD